MKKISACGAGLFALVWFVPAARSQSARPTTASRPAAVVVSAKNDTASDPNRGRLQVTQSLDRLAAEKLAARRTAIAAITTRSQAEDRQRQLRDAITAMLGGLPGKTPLNARVIGVTEADGFRMEKVLFESQPNYRVTAILYLPASAGAGKQKLPAIVLSPGHSPAGKASDYAFASSFARNGFVVLSYDIVGEGERLQYPDPSHPGASLASRPTGEHGLAGLQPTLIGDAVARYFLWDAMRAVDYLASRPEVDPDRVGAFGCSGGGMVTAILGALDTRVKAIASACYITSFDELLPTAGPQEAEQTIPGFIAAGFDLADWIEMAAPRPYAVISTASDMFPYAGARASVAEARHFYSLFNPAVTGTPTGQPALGIPTGPTLNPDTSNTIPASAPLQWITGIGGHGNLRPLERQIVEFFLTHLAHSSTAFAPTPAGAAAPATGGLQVTPTGQVLTSYPNSETIHTINLKRYAFLPRPKAMSTDDLAGAVRDVTHAVVKPGDPAPVNKLASPLAPAPAAADHVRHRLTLATAPGITIDAEFYRPANGRHPAILMLRDSLDPALEASRAEDIRSLRALADSGTAVLVIAPRPSPAGTEEVKSPLLGSFYLTTLRAEFVDKTLLGLRVDDVIAAVNFLSHGTTVDPLQISASASGHLGLVLMHAAVLDTRLRQVTVDHVLESYKSLIEAPVPDDAAEDILPGVVRHYDIPDLVRTLGLRLTFNAPRTMTAVTTRATP
jgi:cephalosporin-C deacetylase-like acetyl esterase